MGAARTIRALWGVTTLLVSLFCASNAGAQEPVPKGSRFGERSSFVLSAERLAGYQSQEIGESSVDSIGFHPIYWSGLGLHGVMDSGLTLGTLLGVTYLSFSNEDDDESSKATLIWLRPRIGYAGSLEKNFGYWARLGPTALLAIDHDDDNGSQALSAGLELYAVIMASPHVGFLVGPHVEIKLAADEDENKYGSVGFTLGLLGDIY